MQRLWRRAALLAGFTIYSHCVKPTTIAEAASDAPLISATTAASTPLWGRDTVLRRIQAAAGTPSTEFGQQSVPITVVLGHWEATEDASKVALDALQQYSTDVVFSGGDGIEAGTESAQEMPLVARGVASLSPKLHLAFQHVHYLRPTSLYHPNTLFLPHKAFDCNHRAVHSGFTGTPDSPLAVGALADQLDLLEILSQLTAVQPTFVFMGGGKTALAELIALHNGKHKGIVKGTRIVVFRSIPAKNRPTELSLVEQEATKLAALTQASTWVVQENDISKGAIVFIKT